MPPCLMAIQGYLWHRSNVSVLLALRAYDLNSQGEFLKNPKNPHSYAYAHCSSNNSLAIFFEMVLRDFQILHRNKKLYNATDFTYSIEETKEIYLLCRDGMGVNKGKYDRHCIATSMRLWTLKMSSSLITWSGALRVLTDNDWLACRAEWN